MIARKQDVVDQTTKGIVYLMKKNKIDTFYGVGSFVDANTVKVARSDGSGEETITGKNIVIATGSKPMSFPSMPLDKQRVITSTEALKLPEIPKHLIIIGAGVIGAELGSVYARLGAKVSFVEFADSMIPTMDKTMGKELQKSMKKLGAAFYFNHKVTKVENTGDEVVVSIDTPKGETMTLTGDYCLVSVGRKPYTDGLNLEAAGLSADQRGKIEVDDHLRTKVPHIFALGDVIRGAMLAHKAEEEGVFIAETIAGQKPHINYRLIPNVVYTWPEVAAVGYTEEEVKEKGIPYKLGTFPFKALGRARASMDIDGLVKVLAHKDTDELLGVHIIGPRAADIVAEAVVAMEFRASAEDVSRMSHAHPTYTEALKEACLAATDNRAINM